MSEKLTAKELAEAMRRCADCVCDDTCPYASVDHDCSAQMLRDAAEKLDPTED